MRLLVMTEGKPFGAKDAASTPTYKEKHMDIEQLKLVLETLQSVSHDASSLVTLWIWLKFGAALISGLGMAIAIVGVVYVIGRAFRAMEGDRQAYDFLREMRSTLGIGSRGYLDDSERAQTQALLRKLAEDYHAQKRTP
jgi:hypothetical protein